MITEKNHLKEILKNISFYQPIDPKGSYHPSLRQLIKLELFDLNIKHFCQ